MGAAVRRELSHTGKCMVPEILCEILLIAFALSYKIDSCLGYLLSLKENLSLW